MWVKELGYIKQLVMRLGISLLILLIIRLVFFVYNYTFLDSFGWEDGFKIFFFAIRFDIVSVTYVNGIFIILSLLPFTFRTNFWYRSFLSIIFLISNALLFFVEILDIGFYQFAARRTLFGDFFMFSNNKSNILEYFLEYWMLVALWGILIFVAYFLFTKTRVQNIGKGKWYFQTLIFFLGIGLSILGARGGIQLRPLAPIDAATYTTKASLMQLMTNTSINLIFSSQQRGVSEKNYFPKENISNIYNTIHEPQMNGDASTFNSKNVVILIMESLSKEYMGTFSENKNFTPFLDSLVEHCFYLENSFANGLRSTEGIAAITAGFPHLMYDSFIFSAYQTNKLDAISSLLQGEGYQTAFFHGCYPGSMNFDSFSKAIGFEKFIDKTVYNNDLDDDGHWGIWDIPFFEYTVDELSKFESPFFAAMFSLTSHHPFNVEPWFEKKYPKMDKHFRTVLYADLAMKRFFEKAKETDWYENTLFVILGDHTGPRLSKPYQTALGRYKIPILLFDPTGKIKGNYKGVSQQIDILPTIMSHLNYQKPYFAFGQNMLDTSAQKYAIMRVGGIFQICDEQYVLKFDGEKSLFLFDYQKDELLSNNILDQFPEVTFRLENEIKARIQRYNNAIIYNQLSADRR